MSFCCYLFLFCFPERLKMSFFSEFSMNCSLVWKQVKPSWTKTKIFFQRERLMKLFRMKKEGHAGIAQNWSLWKSPWSRLVLMVGSPRVSLLALFRNVKKWTDLYKQRVTCIRHALRVSTEDSALGSSIGDGVLSPGSIRERGWASLDLEIWKMRKYRVWLNWNVWELEALWFTTGTFSRGWVTPWTQQQPLSSLNVSYRNPSLLESPKRAVFAGHQLPAFAYKSL